MGMDYNADLGYGFKLTDPKLIEDLNEGKLKEGKEFKIIYSGNAWGDDHMATYLCIKASCHDTYCYADADNPIPTGSLIVKDSWNELLTIWAKEHDVKLPKIGWWLLSSVV